MSLYACSAYVPMKSKLALRFLFLFLSATTIYIIYQRISFMPDIHSHLGDGRFENISEQHGIIAIPGYCIKMPEFNLAKPKQEEYRLAKMPTPPRECFVYFAINTDDDNWENKIRKNIRSTLQLQLWDSSGRIIVNLNVNLSDCTAYSSTRMHFIALYPPNHNTSFFPDARENYTVRITYNPDLTLNVYQGFVYFECGGIK